MSQVEIKALENGPNVVFVDGKVLTAMCRCGASANKPYCDGSHGKVGFKASPSELRLVPSQEPRIEQG
jgi:CDGSH-type Zn-finger protein